MGIAERKEREKDRRRNEIIDAAEKVMFSKGFDIMTMDDVALEAELSKGTLYLYFKNKEELFYAIFERGADILLQMLSGSIKPGNKGLDNLLIMGKTFIRFSREHGNYFSLFKHFETNASHCKKTNIENFDTHIVNESPIALVIQCVDQGFRDGSLRKDIDKITLATTLWTQMMGLIVVADGEKEVYETLQTTTEQIFQTHFEILINGIKQP